MTDAVQLHPADCREVMRAMEPCSVDAVISDPPYGLGKGPDPLVLIRHWLAQELRVGAINKLEALGWSEVDARELAGKLHPESDYVPKGAGFMAQKWDAFVPGPEYWREVYRVLKPGGYVLAFGAARTWHWLACALELAGLESRGSIAWLQGQGMQHGLDISKAMDADAGAEREIIGPDPQAARRNKTTSKYGGAVFNESPDAESIPLTAPATDEAREWAGWGTQLAPKHEPIAMFRKPLKGTTVANVRAHGVGGLNIDGCRLEGGKAVPASVSKTENRVYGAGHGGPNSGNGTGFDPTVGRWPPNVALDEAAAAQLDAMVGKLPRAGNKSSSMRRMGEESTVTRANVAFGGGPSKVYDSQPGGPSAFFYCPKAPTGERDRGCEHLRWVRAGDGWRLCEAGEEAQLVGNPHPTCKPLELMRWLVRLVTPPWGLVLDPFMGSGSTGVAAVREGMRFEGADSLPMAHTIARARIRWAQGLGPDVSELPRGVPAQSSLFK